MISESTAKQSLAGASVDRAPGRPGLILWVVLVAVLVGATTGALVAGGREFLGPTALFWIVTIAAALCAVAAAVVITRAFLDRLAEPAFLGAGLWAVSVLPLVHGLSAPGVLFEDNTAVVLGAFLALPLALLSALPVLAPRWPISRALAAWWRAWVVGAVTITTVVAGVLLAAPNAFPAPSPGSVISVAVGVAGAGAMMAFSWRQLTLYWVSHRPATFVVSVAFAFLGVTSLVWIHSTPFTFGWWLIHVLDIVGVFAGCFGIIVAHRIGRPVTELLAPVISRDPLVALEFGLAPIVHDFVAALDRKDPTTRDHVIRTAETAMRVGVRVGLPPERLRYLGLGGLLHDIGKLEIPDKILNKPSVLDTQEFQIMQSHTEIGARLLAVVPLLAPAAPIVRAHHERIDGTGYPDGLHRDAIPLEARIISICDAFDAIVHTRHYRAARDTTTAFAILLEHAGQQWDEAIVIEAIPILESIQSTPQLDRVGRPLPPSWRSIARNVCPDALPASLTT